jgi:hypothetical protein
LASLSSTSEESEKVLGSGTEGALEGAATGTKAGGPVCPWTGWAAGDSETGPAPGLAADVAEKGRAKGLEKLEELPGWLEDWGWVGGTGKFGRSEAPPAGAEPEGNPKLAGISAKRLLGKFTGGWAPLSLWAGFGVSFSTGTKFHSSLEAAELALPAADRWPDKDCDVPPTKESELTTGVEGKAGKAGLKPEEAPLGNGLDGLFASTPRQPSSLLAFLAKPGGAEFGGFEKDEEGKDDTAGELGGGDAKLGAGVFVGAGVGVSTGAFWNWRRCCSGWGPAAPRTERTTGFQSSLLPGALLLGWLTIILDGWLGGNWRKLLPELLLTDGAPELPKPPEYWFPWLTVGPLGLLAKLAEESLEKCCL